MLAAGTPAETDGAWLILPNEAEPNPGRFRDLLGVGFAAASTAIDCADDATSPACILGVASLALGTVGVDPMDMAKHVKLLPKALGALGASAGAVAWADSFNDWLYRRNFGNG
jgi:hypothetical protein